ncbi:MAG: NAD-dependent deacylase [Proteobacteria bacterium]|nr:NAD-dependent protein deacylase [Cystobacterineae bacterium]MCL2259654.1 NAD-dependent protein deacylase [Cystobacterineae bacterium]MCL2315263.1 NAD-dependent deacylase [Pseudomonadota bacterium]
MANTLKKLVALTGAGISAESGIKTFRDSGGLWEQYDVMEVASIGGWRKNPQLMQRFYNERRKQLSEVEPNAAHRILAELEAYFDVTVVTQNVDNLHERAQSSKILHLHGELTKARSCADSNWVLDIGYRPIEWGETAPDGSLLRPHIVWFGEAVPMIGAASETVAEADILVVVGTSLNVYPAAGLVAYAPRETPIYVVDPNDIVCPGRNVTSIREKATAGMEKLKKMLLE